MNKYEMVAAIIFMATSGAIAMTLITSWFRYREKTLAARGSAASQDPRLARIESAIEAVAIEVERISEAQRFTTRLLTERHGAPAPAVGAGQPLKHPEETHHVR